MIALGQVSPSRAPFPETPASGQQFRRERQLVDRLRRSAAFRSYQQAFEQGIGLPLTLQDPETLGLAHAGSRRENQFCRLMAANGKSCSGCLEVQRRLRAQAQAQPHSLICFAGLMESAVPVRIGERVVAFLHVGQVLRRDPSQAQFRRTAAQLEAWQAGVDLPRLREAYFRTRVIGRRQYEAIVKMLTIFARQLAALSNQLVMESESGDPPVIARARRYIADHLDEEITLERIAHAAHTSRYYLCKRFRRVTGLNLLDYVARARVERAKQLLLQPHSRIGEAAYAAGFQSLSQFNRAFKRVVGEQPRTWRAQAGS